MAMNIIRHFFLAAVLVLPVSLFGQKVYKSKAQRHEAKNHFQDASRAYLGLHDAGNRDALISAAMNLYHGHQFESALPNFVKADSLALIDDPEEICFQTKLEFL